MTDIKYLGVQGLEELITITKNNLAKKADTLQFDVMPDPVKYTGKVVQYVGVSDLSYTRSHFYYSDGTRWTEETISDVQTTQIKFVNALPDWISADPQVLYVLKGTENKLLSLYVKNTAVNDSWYTTESSGSFAIVNDLPQWSDANASTIYFKANGDALTGYIKNTEASDAWYTLGGATQEIDIALSSTSTNPVQNKVVHAAIQEVRDQVTSVYHYKGSCLTAALPSEGNVVGDTWNLEDASSYGPTGVNVAWTGTEWDALSGDINYMRGLHDPDWSKAIVQHGVRISTPTTYHLIFTCPARGNLIIKLMAGDAYIKINNSEIVKPSDTQTFNPLDGISFPVNKGDTLYAKREYADTYAWSYIFVPYKVQ